MPPTPIADLPQALWQVLRRVAVWALLAGLAVGLPLQALSSTLAGLLGSRHAHHAAPSSSPSPDRSGDPMAGWKDFRRAGYEHPAGVETEPASASSSASMHRQAHEAGLRHRHAPDDAGVVDLEAPADGDGAPTGSSPAGAAFALAADAGRLEPLPRPGVDGDEVWRTASARSIATTFPRRIERPPSSA
ncbi:MAG TPA: hypothetical protein VMR43_03620 [Variovorax sp.]|nr:hypothetical protein [Variovorax sp.]